MKIAVLGAPINFGANVQGPEKGPESLRSAGLLKALQNHEVVDFGDIIPKITSKPYPKNAKHLSEITNFNKKLALKVKYLKNKGYFPLVIGGDHDISVGILAGTAIKGKKQSVLWVDAHPDFNTPKTTWSGKIFGMGLAVSSGLGPKELTGIMGNYPKIDVELSAALGIRNIDKGEQVLISKHNLKIYTMEEISKKNINSILKEILQKAKKADLFHVSIDLDFLDPSIAPGVSTPVKQGMSEKEAVKLCSLLGRANIMTSCDITELNPLRDVDQKTARIACKLVRELFLKK